LDLPGLLYHVIARGIERREIFRDARDRETFVDRLGELAIAEVSSLATRLHNVDRSPLGHEAFLKSRTPGTAARDD
jgi:hypothetical protein